MSTNTIKIKRSTGTAAPTTDNIVAGELATTMDSSNNGASNKVWLGIQNQSSGVSVVPIGGNYYTSAIDNLAYFKTIAVQGQGNVVANTAIAGSTLTLAGGSGINIATDAATDTVTISSTGTGTVTGITFGGDYHVPPSVPFPTITTTGTVRIKGKDNEIYTYSSNVSDPNSIDINIGFTQDTKFIGEMRALKIITDEGTDEHYYTLEIIKDPNPDNDGIINISSTTTNISSVITNISHPLGTTNIDSAYTNIKNLYANSITPISNGSVTIASNAIITGNLTVNGTTTTINSTTTTVEDPIFVLGANTSSDDGKDRGIEFRWYDGENSKIGFFGWDDSAGAFSVLSNATNTNEVFSVNAGNRANIHMGNVIRLHSASNSSHYSDIQSLPSGTNTLTLPNTTGTLATLAGSEEFSNKTIDGGTF